MPASALGLALGAAFIHALWNVLLARARETEGAAVVALASAVLVFAPGRMAGAAAVAAGIALASL